MSLERGRLSKTGAATLVSQCHNIPFRAYTPEHKRAAQGVLIRKTAVVGTRK